MKAKKFIYIVLCFLLIFVVASTAFTLSLNAGGGGAGEWEKVCCGAGCGGTDYCLGTGSYTCCK